MHTKGQTIQAEWLAILSNVVDPVPAALPADITTTIIHIDNNTAPGSDDLNLLNENGQLHLEDQSMCIQERGQ